MGRLQITVEGEPREFYIFHCDFCQKRTGSAFAFNAALAEGRVIRHVSTDVAPWRPGNPSYPASPRALNEPTRQLDIGT